MCYLRHSVPEATNLVRRKDIQVSIMIALIFRHYTLDCKSERLQRWYSFIPIARVRWVREEVFQFVESSRGVPAYRA